MPHDPDRNVLFRLLPTSEAAEGIPDVDPASLERTVVEKLRAARARRSTPIVDRALYADINGSFVRGLVGASRLLGDSSILAVARRTADRFLGEAYDPTRGIGHRLGPDGASGFGHLEDQVQFALGLVELAGATGEPVYLTACRQLLHLIDAEYRGEGGLLRDLAPSLYDGPTVGAMGAATYPVEDNPHLAANAGAVLAFERYASLTGDGSWVEKSKPLVEALSARLRGAGLFGAGAALSAALLEVDPARVVITGDGPGAEALLRAAETVYHPNAWVFRGAPPAGFSLPEEAAAAAVPEGPPRALVCFGNRCLAPITEPGRVRELLSMTSHPES